MKLFLFIIFFINSISTLEIHADHLCWHADKEKIDQAKKSQCWNQQDEEHVTQLQESLKNNLAATQHNHGRQSELLTEQILKDYETLQNYLAYCRAASISHFLNPTELHNQAPFPNFLFEDKLLLHVVGDSFGENSGLEGLTAGNVDHLEHRQKLYRHLETIFNNRTFIARQEQQPKSCFRSNALPESLELPLPDFAIEDLKLLSLQGENAILLTQALHKSPGKFHSVLSKQMETYLQKPGQTIYFQGGWLGHAIVFEITKQENGRYSFRVYNSGEGLEFHPAFNLGSRRRVFPFVEKVNVSADTLFGSVFSKVLYDLRQFGDDATADGSSTKLYWLLHYSLDGTQTTRKPSFEDSLDPQQSGTCGYYSIPYYLESAAKDKPQSKLLEFYIRTLSFRLYIENNRARIRSVPEVFKLAEKSFQVLNLELARQRNPGQKPYISYGEERYFSERYDEYKNFFIEAQKIHEQATSSSRNIAHLTTADSAQVGAGFPWIQSPEYVEEQDAIQNIRMRQIQNWVADPMHLKDSLLEFIADFEKTQSANYKIAAYDLDSIKLLVMKIPLEEKIWAELSSQDLRSLLGEFQKLGELYLWSILKNIYHKNSKEQRGIAPIEYFVQVKLLTIANIIKETLGKRPDSKYLDLSTMPSLYLPDFDNYLYAISSSILISDAIWAEEVIKMQAYWLTRKRAKSFFRVENMPTIMSLQNIKQLTAVLSNPPSFLFFKSEYFYENSQYKNYFYQFSNIDLSGWEYVRWLKENLSKFPVKEHQENFSDLEKTLNWTTSGYNDPFIQDVLAIRSLSFATYYLLRGSFDLEDVSYIINNGTREDGIGKKRCSSYHDSFHCEYKLFNTPLPVPSVGSSKSDPEKYETLQKNFFFRLKPYFYLNMHQPLDSKYENILSLKAHKKEQEDPKGDLSLKERVSTGQASRSLLPIQKKITLENFRKLLHLSGDKDLQVAETWSYIHENPSILFFEDDRNFIERLLFEPGLIEAEILKNRLFPYQVATFLNKQHEAHNQDPFQALYDLRLNQIFMEQTLLVWQKYPERFTTEMNPFLSSRDILITMLKEKPNSLLKNSISRDLIRTFVHDQNFATITEADFEWFLIALIYRKQNPSNLTENASHLETEIQSLHLLKAKDISDRLKKNPHSLFRILTYFYENVDFGEKPVWKNTREGEWTLETSQCLIFNTLCGTQKLAQLQIKELSLTYKSQHRETLPEQIKNSRDVQRLIGVTPDNAVATSNFYEVKGHAGYVYRLHTNGTILKYWGNRWYSLVTEKTELLKTLYNNEDLPYFLDFDHWFELENQDDHKPPFLGFTNTSPYIREQGLQQNKNHIELILSEKSNSQVQFVMFARTQSLEEKQIELEEEAQELALITKPNDSPIEDKSTEDKSTEDKYRRRSRKLIDSVRKITNDGKVLPLLLSTLPVELENVFRGFEDKHHIQVWLDEKSKLIDHISLPRFNLRLKMKSDGSLVCERLPGFILAKDQYSSLLGNLPHVLFWENGNERIAMLARFNVQKKGLLFNENYSVDQKSLVTPEGSQKYFIYNFSSKGSRIEYSSREARFYLAFLYGHLFEFHKAFRILREADAQLLKLNASEKEVLSWIDELGSNDLASLGLKTLATLIIQKMNFHHFLNDPDDWAKLRGKYHKYLEARRPSSPEWLLASEESFITDKLGVYAPSRFSELAHGLSHIEKVDQQNNFVMGPPSSNWGGLSYQFAQRPSSSPDNLFSEKFVDSVFLPVYEIFLSIERRENPQEKISKFFAQIGLPFNPKSAILDFNQLLTTIVGISSSRKSVNRTATGFMRFLHASSGKGGKFPTLEKISSFITDNYRLGSEELDRKILALFGISYEEFYGEEGAKSILDKTPPYSPPNADSDHGTISYDKKSALLDVQIYDFDSHVKPDASFARYNLEQAILSDEDILSYFNEVDNKEGTQQEGSVSFSGLKDIQAKDPYITNFIADIHKKLTGYSKKLSEVKLYQIKDTEKIAILKDRLLADDRTLEEQTTALGKKVLELARKIPDDLRLRMNRNQDLRSERDAEPNIDDLVRLFASKDLQSFLRHNLKFQELELDTLYQQLRSFLLLSTYQGHLKSLISLLPLKSVTEASAFVNKAKQKREFIINDHPDWLAFEYYMGFLLRSAQVNAIRFLKLQKKEPTTAQHIFNTLDEDGTLLEMAMGLGKSSVLMPLLARSHTEKGKTLSVVVLPTPLIPSMSDQLSRQLGQLFGMPVDVINVQRKHNYDANKTEILLSRFQQSLQDGRIIVMSHSDVQSLFLIFIEKLRTIANSRDPELSDFIQSIRNLREIISLLRTKAQLIIDEVDTIFDIMKSHRFAIGNVLKIENDLITAVLALYKLLINDMDLQQQVAIPFLRNSNKTPFTAELYHSLIKPALIEKLTQSETYEVLFPSNDEKDTRRILQTLDKNALKKFLASSEPQLTRTYLDTISSIQVRNLLATWYTSLHSIMPLTLGKTMQVHYGLYPKLDSCAEESCPHLIAIPYSAGQPSPESRFGSDLESIHYTIQTHLELGEVDDMLQVVIKQLRDSYRKARSNNLKVRLNKKIQYYFPDVAPNDFLSSGFDWKSYTPSLQNDSHKKLKLIADSVPEQLLVFDTQLFTNGHIYHGMFKRIVGFSGTLWNVHTYPDFYSSKQMSDTLEKTLFVLGKNGANHVHILSHNGPTLADKISALFKENNATSVIDQGAFLKGFPNVEVAKAILNSNSNKVCQQIVYYNEHDILKVYSRDGQISDYHERIERELTCAYWDLRHTTGSDLKVSKSNVAIMTVSKHTILRDLLQSVWRLRELDQNQRVIFTMTQEDASYAESLMKNEFDRSERVGQIEDLLLFVITNEANLLSSQVHRAANASFQDELIYSFLDRLDLDIFELADLYAKFRPLFEKERLPEPYQRYGFAELSLTAKEALNLEAQKLLRITDDMTPKSQLSNALQAIIRRKLPFLKENVIAQASIELEQAVEVDVNKETQMDNENQTEEETEEMVDLSSFDTGKALKPRLVWQLDKWKTGYYFSEISSKQITQDCFDRKKKGYIHSAYISFIKQKQDCATLNPLLSVNDALELDNWGELTGVFDPKLLISLNLAPVFDLQDSDKKTAFFSAHQKEMNEILVEIRNGKVEHLALIDREDALTLGDFIINGNSSQKEVQYFIYFFGSGWVRFNDQGQTASEWQDYFDQLERDPNFLRLLSQAKFLSGRTDYSPDEIQSLKTWLENLDAKKMEILFTKVILKYRFDSHKDYPLSVLKECFLELIDKSSN